MKLHSLATSHQHPAPKCLIYSPYFGGIGGGERYMLSTAECLLDENWQVDVFWDNKKGIIKIGQKIDLNLTDIHVLGVKPQDLSLWQRLKLTRSYDLVFWLSDGSLPAIFGKKNILHFQRPFKNVGGKKIITQIKLGLVNKVICNSKFTKKYIDSEFGLDSRVLYPPVAVDNFKQGDKKKIILSVGRFVPNKKQDALIKVFKEMIDSGLIEWKLVLIGGSLDAPEDNQYLQTIKKSASNYPIKILVDVSFDKLKSYYARSKLYWHGAGYGVDESKRPWDCEHFGIAPIEAMAAGCVPLVVKKGGLKEIVRRGEGETWRTLKELKVKSLELIENKEKYNEYQKNAIKRAQKFSKQKFCKKFKSIIE